MTSGSFGKIACRCSYSTDKPTLGPLCQQEGSGGLSSFGVLFGVAILKQYPSVSSEKKKVLLKATALYLSSAHLDLVT